ncbi:hypothetical protein PW5551_10305 [Petrotoga sp. 9PW.55.5.1]|uniref:hypothetical protein n=1 Tax=Petrotoga sp. 9PW.55.5.1 TaxID=1308979 RepID=UPI000DC2BED4|nr:hypothetical protein [Petrotoga sp. 9PW.55.5.1]RAO98361.1 hypothetical protein PW5551_10305 [Petrotoga sp. 9PW.55.5.1]
MRNLRVFLVFCVILSLGLSIFSAEKIIRIVTEQKTDLEVPYVISFSELLDLVGEDFDANWYSIRVKDSSNKDIPYQIVDIDQNGRISSSDKLLFTFKKEAKIVVSDNWDLELLQFNPIFTVEEKDGEYIITSDKFSVKVNNHGLANFVKFNNVEGNLYNELGTARIAGWSGSTYYVDEKLGRHVETTSAGLNVKELKIYEAGPVAVCVQGLLYYEDLPGFNQKISSYIFKTGDILVENEFSFTNYVDIMKLQVMATAPLTSLDDNAFHILPMFRRMIWAEQLGISPYEYWKERDAVINVEENSYIAFPAIESMKPLWWGATYCFVSMENWRANFSDKYNLIAAEILPEKPVIYSDLQKFVYGDFWFYESREFRDGIFRWIPGELNIYEATKGVFEDTKEADWMMKFKAGDKLTYTRYFSMYSAKNSVEAIKLLENRTHEIQNVKLFIE